MVYLVTRTWVPIHKALDVVKIGFERMKKFDWGKYGQITEQNKHGDFITSTIMRLVKDGIESVTTQKVCEGKLEDAMKRVIESNTFFVNVEGWSMQMDVYHDMEDFTAIATSAGIQLPKAPE
ncbi:MAG: hypothetical protein ACFFCS_10600 [Candidatus Hodarchaeota archaeon]